MRIVKIRFMFLFPCARPLASSFFISLRLPFEFPPFCQPVEGRYISFSRSALIAGSITQTPPEEPFHYFPLDVGREENDFSLLFRPRVSLHVTGRQPPFARRCVWWIIVVSFPSFCFVPFFFFLFLPPRWSFPFFAGVNVLPGSRDPP